MIRISVQNAQLGMTLARAVYDSTGKLVLSNNTVLDMSHLPLLERLDVRGIIVQDPRVDDVIIVPLISEDVEAQAVRQLHYIMDADYGNLPEYVKVDMVRVEHIVKDMLQGLYSTLFGEMSIEGCISAANYEYFHPVKATGLAMMIGKELGFSKHDMSNLGKACLLQNIGYTLLSKEVIMSCKPDKEANFPDYIKHPELGYRIIGQNKDIDKSVPEGIAAHHERWSGTGFPRGLKGDKIPLFGRIISLASTFHALVSRRHGEPPFSPPEAAEYIVAYSGEYFDPDLVQIFLKNAPLYPKGVMVKLNTGESGIVVETNVGYIGRPRIRICLDRNNRRVESPYELDLTQPEFQSQMITEILYY